MSESDLIPLNKRTKEQRTAIQRKGGLVKSARKTQSCRLNPLKHGKYSKHFSEDFAVMLKHPEDFDSMMLTQLKKILEMPLNAYQRIQLQQAIVQTRKALFGEIHKNLNIHIVAYKEDIEWARQYYMKKKENKDLT